MTQTLDQQLETLSRRLRWLWKRVPVALGTASILIAALYAGFIVVDVFRGARQPTSPLLPPGLEEVIVVATPILGAAVAVVALLVNWRTLCGWLGLLLHIGCGTAVFILGTIAVQMSKVDH